MQLRTKFDLFSVIDFTRTAAFEKYDGRVIDEKISAAVNARPVIINFLLFLLFIIKISYKDISYMAVLLKLA